MQQKKAIRIISDSGYNAHTAPLFNSLDILPLAKVITQTKLTFMRSVYYGHVPTSFTNTWQTQAQRIPDLNLRNATDIYIPFQRTDLFKRLPLYSLPYIWNSHDTVRYYANHTTFRYGLHDLLHSATDQAAEQQQ
jgi:hypothetical protein